MSHRPDAERESTHERQDPLPDVMSESLETKLEVEEARKNENDDGGGSSCTSEVHRRSVDGRCALGPLFDMWMPALQTIRITSGRRNHP